MFSFFSVVVDHYMLHDKSLIKVCRQWHILPESDSFVTRKNTLFWQEEEKVLHCISRYHSFDIIHQTLKGDNLIGFLFPNYKSRSVIAKSTLSMTGLQINQRFGLIGNTMWFILQLVLLQLRFIISRFGTQLRHTFKYLTELEHGQTATRGWNRILNKVWTTFRIFLRFPFSDLGTFLIELALVGIRPPVFFLIYLTLSGPMGQYITGFIVGFVKPKFNDRCVLLRQSCTSKWYPWSKHMNEQIY